MVEVLDHYRDFELTVGQCHDLLVLAENANDNSRETFGPVHEDWIRDRAGGKTAKAWRNAIGALMAKKVLEYAVRDDGREMRGHPGQWAVYKIRHLCPEAKRPHDGRKGRCTHPERATHEMTQSTNEDHAERVTRQRTQSKDDQSAKGHPPEDPIARMGHPTGANGSPTGGERVIQQVTPTPLSPQTPLSFVDVSAQLVRETGLVSAGDERETVEKIKNTYPDRSPGWWRKIAANGDLAQIVADQQTAQTGQPASAPRWCGCCGGGNPAARTNIRFRTDSGMPGGIPCPDCHPLTTGRTA
ncbi:hypothetical protein [Frankia sp. R82]|uniref:hypothetical protein n=1 Tax=Frankia sp. R82 TaxID=2950553 RepID=UPI00204461AE|nr:hypothetical protein [Frankia sp. R82]MCM3886117.1 hypothetical protein [Frankia sp. R82]